MCMWPVRGVCVCMCVCVSLCVCMCVYARVCVQCKHDYWSNDAISYYKFNSLTMVYYSIYSYILSMISYYRMAIMQYAPASATLVHNWQS